MKNADSHIQAAAVLLAKDWQQLAAFYSSVVAFPRRRDGTDHAILESPGFQLIVHGIPEHIAAHITVPVPAVPREDATVKLVFFVEDLAQARAEALRLGGSLKKEEQQWRFEDCLVCDGHDPEGNVFQLRQRLP